MITLFGSYAICVDDDVSLGHSVADADDRRALTSFMVGMTGFDSYGCVLIGDNCYDFIGELLTLTDVL